MPAFYDLPKPNQKEADRSIALKAHLLQCMNEKGGYLPFNTFMENALYHPIFGYYNAASFSLGTAGDFTTAPLISPLFAQCFAAQAKQLFDRLTINLVLEIGAGTGHFARDFLLALAGDNALPKQYCIYEISHALREKQQNLLQEALPHYFKNIIWLDALPASFEGLVIANEVLDALPFDCFCIKEKEIKERCVGFDKDQFHWLMRAPHSDALQTAASCLLNQYQLAEGYESEINLTLPDFIATIAASLSRGVILFADYGYGEALYYHPERYKGTLTCFYQHYRHDNPFFWPGLQDITAHVNFTAVAQTAINTECQLVGYTSQASFLLGAGLIKLAEKSAPPAATEAFKVQQAIKQLTFPTEMGERIKIMALAKNIENLEAENLMGFQLHDRRWDL